MFLVQYTTLLRSDSTEGETDMSVKKKELFNI